MFDMKRKHINLLKFNQQYSSKALNQYLKKNNQNLIMLLNGIERDLQHIMIDNLRCIIMIRLTHNVTLYNFGDMGHKFLLRFRKNLDYNGTGFIFIGYR